MEIDSLVINENTSCKECGVLHAKPNEHEFDYAESTEILNKRGLVDSVSLQPFYEPIDLNCGHTFSKSSIEEVFRNKKECPMCRKKTSKMNETHQIIRNQLNDLQVKCPNHCGIEIERQFLKNHLLDCPKLKKYCLNKCDDKKCNFIGIKTEMDEHHKVCDLRTIICGGMGKCSIVALHLEEHNCFTDLIKKVSRVLEQQTHTHKLEINSLKNAQKHQDEIINQQKQIIEQNTICIKKYQDDLNLLHNHTSIQNILLQSQKKTTEAQEHKSIFFDKRLCALEYINKKSTNLSSNSLTLPSSDKSLSKTTFSSLSSSSFSSFSSLTKDAFGKNSKPMFLPKPSSIEDNKDLNNDNDNDKDNKTETSLVENKTTLSTNDRKRKAEDDVE
jgi:hypothetical protein